ncbi:hypothetical protein [Blastococcus sp. TF02A-26]|uniref:hypothetical protein n=1 Tax=Blastococcus sp. TF02A-26 TaxID=2250577 RepID=UPI000DE95388|nr:hypothetical protein [Blastococcus sp. TF02A-26]RBY82686.1 hypothetical protein DQ240_18505 [Blastococcus sp. TF02A-26]
MTTRVLYGHLRTGRILGELSPTGCSWAQTLNGAGSIDQVTVPNDVIERLQLRQTVMGPRAFLAVEQDDRIQEAGPIWTFPYDWVRGQLTLGAAGLWSLFDYRKVIPVLAAGQRVQDPSADTTIAGTDLGGIARALVAQAMTHVGGDLPLVLPEAAAGTRTETFPGYKLLNVGQQLRELTQRETAAPDIRFPARRNPDDRRFLQWLMETGTEQTPQLAQIGRDWVFDTTTRRSPVLGIGTEGDATVMGSRAWVTGNGSERDMLIATASNTTLLDAGYPPLEQEESRSSVEQQDTLDGHAANLRDRSARPVEVWKVTVHASAATEVRAGDYARVKTAGHPWLGTGEHRLRIRKKTGNLTDRVVLDMYPLQAALG